MSVVTSRRLPNPTSVTPSPIILVSYRTSLICGRVRYLTIDGPMFRLPNGKGRGRRYRERQIRCRRPEPLDGLTLAKHR